MKRRFQIAFLATFILPTLAPATEKPVAWHELVPVTLDGDRESVLKVKFQVELPSDFKTNSVDVEVRRFKMTPCLPAPGKNAVPPFPSFAACPGKAIGRAKRLECRRLSSATTYRCQAETAYAERDLRRGFLVRYFALSTASCGRSPAAPCGSPLTKPIFFGVGEPPRYGPYDTAVPLRLHAWRAIGSKGTKDIGFLPSPEYLLRGQAAGYLDFLAKSAGLIAGAFFGGEKDRYSRIFHFVEDDVNLWAGGFGAEVANPKRPNFLCDFSIPPSLSLVRSAMDAVVLVHEWDSAKECSRIYLATKHIPENPKATVHATRGSLSPWVFVHEAGHFLFGQSDEYCCDGGYAPYRRYSNVYMHPPGPYLCSAKRLAELKVGPGEEVYRCIDGYLESREIMDLRQPVVAPEKSDWGESSCCAIHAVFPWVQCPFSKQSGARRDGPVIAAGPALTVVTPTVPGLLIKMSVSRDVRSRDLGPTSVCHGGRGGVECICRGVDFVRRITFETESQSARRSGLRIAGRAWGETLVTESHTYAQEGGGIITPTDDEVTVFALPRNSEDRSSLRTLRLLGDEGDPSGSCAIDLGSVLDILLGQEP